MDEQKSQDEQKLQKLSRLTKFLDQLRSDADLRKSFLSTPLATVNSSLGLPQLPDGVNHDLANDIVLAVLRSPQAMETLKEIQIKREANQLDELQSKTETAKVLLDAAPQELQYKLVQLWGGVHPKMPGFDPKPAMANLIVHVDAIAVLTKAAIIHSDYVFNGASSPGFNEIQKVANALSQGQ